MLSLRVPQDKLDRWKQAANDAGESITAFVSDAVDARVAGALGGGPVKTAGRLSRAERTRAKGPVSERGTPDRPAAASERTRGRAAMCEHRISPTAFCKVCDG